MVRALVGTLLDVGYGKTSINEFKAIISAKNRIRAGQTVPPQGLYLCEVRYPKTILLKK
jgi:tRNA pseudouridine38-40 synthase